MTFNAHSNLPADHAFLSASKYHWINYDEDKLKLSYSNFLAAQKGTELHEFAATCIRLKQKLPKSNKTLNQYVNDAIGYRMTPEQVLYFSDNCYGTADAICFRDDFLRIHDLKTGITPAHMDQLMIYATLFCMEYRHDPGKIQIELRIYQDDSFVVEEPEPGKLFEIKDKIIKFDKIIREIRGNAL